MDKWHKYQDWQGSFNRFLGNEFWDDFRDIFRKDDPPSNLYESAESLLCIVSLPGLSDMKNISVFVNNMTLTLKGQLHYHFDGYKILQNDLYQGAFEKDIPLPYPVENNSIEARYERGLLIIKLNRLIHEDEQQLIIIEDRDQPKP